MATRFYTDPINAPDVSPGYGSFWSVPSFYRRKLVIDAAGNNGSTHFTRSEALGIALTVGVFQFVSEPLDAISATLSVSKGAFRCSEDNAKANASLCVSFRKCDSDGSNDTEIATIQDGVEFEDGTVGTDDVNRFFGPSDLANVTLNQGDRLIVEVGVLFANTKTTPYEAGMFVTDNHATTDLPENDTETAAYNSWIETGDTFTVASGGDEETIIDADSDHKMSGTHPGLKRKLRTAGTSLSHAMSGTHPAVG